MEITLIIIASTLIAACFLVAFAAGFYLGKKYSDNDDKKEAIQITEKNKLTARRYKNLANYNG